MTYQVQRAMPSFRLTEPWDQGQWAKTEALPLTHFMGTQPEHRPDTRAKLLYDDNHLYVFFRATDHYVPAVAETYHDPVYADSCVEFFFTPGKDLGEGYFNLEANCGGVFLFHHQMARGKDQQEVAVEDCRRIDIKASLPKTVDPEIAEPTVWTLQYALPIELLKKYAPVESPARGVSWRANFYKCADHSSHPHWLTWNRVDKPNPDFHVPRCFGTIVFE